MVPQVIVTLYHKGCFHIRSEKRTKLFLGPSSWTWFMINLGSFMRSYLILWVTISTPSSNLGHMPMVLLALQVPNLQIRLRNKWASYNLNSLCQDQLQLRPFLPSRQMYFPCNRWTRKVTSNLEGIKRKEKIIVRVRIEMKMVIIMIRTQTMLGGQAT